jgi:hypothetical protein
MHRIVWRAIARTVAAFCVLYPVTAAAVQTPNIQSFGVAGCNSVRVIWRNVPDLISGIAYYTIHRRANGVEAALANVSGGELPHRHDERRATVTIGHGTFEIGLSATDRAGNSSAIDWHPLLVSMPAPGSVVCRDTRKPERPTQLTVTHGANTCVDAYLDWENAQDLPGISPHFPWTPIPASGIRAYRVYRDGELVNEGTVSQFHDALAPGRGYRYTVTAVDHAGNESLASQSFDFATPEECALNIVLGDRPVIVYGAVPADHAPPPYSMADLSAALFGDAAGTLRDFFRETSYGRATFHAAAATGFWILPHDTAHYCQSVDPATGNGSDCDEGALISDVVAASGITPAPGDVTLYLIKGVSGQYQQGNRIWMRPPQALPLQLWRGPAVHEFSHLFHWRHAWKWTCPTGVPGPDVNDLHAGCNTPVSDDPYSPLAQNMVFRHHPAYTKRVMGFLGPDSTATATVDGDYTIGALEDPGEATKDFRIPVRDPSDARFYKPPFYTVEYRAQQGYAGSAGSALDGLVIRIVPATSQGVDSLAFFVKEISLAPGASIFHDPYNDLGVRLLSIDGKKATVRVCGIGANPCPPDFFQ